MGRQVQIRMIIVRLAVVLTLTAAFVTAVYRWPRTALPVVYLTVCAILIVQYARQVFFMSGHEGTWNTVMVNLARTALVSDPPLTRFRRLLSACFVIVASAIGWPKNALLWLIVRPFYRRDTFGQTVPRIQKRIVLFYSQYLLDGALFALVPLALLSLGAAGHGDKQLTFALFLFLAIHLFARHLAMLTFPHDLKTSLRRTPGDPRVLFLIYLCIDTFAFAVLVQYLALHAGAGPVTLNSFTRVAVDLVSVSELRGLIQAIKQAFDTLGIDTGVFAPATKVTPSQAIEMLCSGFVSLNIVHLLFPLNSWKQNDDDLKVLVRGFLLSGAQAEARAYIEKIEKYDEEAAGLDACLDACQGDLNAAAKKIRWMHAQNGLPDDKDLVFIDTFGPTILVMKYGVDTARCVDFALETKVSDVILAVYMLLLHLDGRVNPRPPLEVIKARNCLQDYLLSASVLEFCSGDRESASQRINAHAAGDAVSRCVTIMLNEISASGPGPSLSVVLPTVYRSAEEIAQILGDVDIGALSLSRQLALVSILTMMRCAVASVGGTTAPLEALTSTVVTKIRESYPSHRSYASNLANYARVAERQARKEARRKRKGFIPQNV